MRVAALVDSQRFDDAKTQAETGKILQDMEMIATENERLKMELSSLQQQAMQQIEAQLDAMQL